MNETVRYVKGVSETMSYEEAEEFFEVRGSEVTRQVTKLGDRWFCSLDEWAEPIGMLLTDQPVQEGEFGPEDEITREEFEAAWARAVAQR
jgi:hypothetical protein